MDSITNYTEIMVENVIDDIIKKYDVCTCEKCKLDIKALSLNSLPPRYFVSEKGKMYKKIEVLDNQLKIDVVSAVTNAALTIKNNPIH
ncbi:competence protein ComFB [Clostridium cavendishii DSM 21758]|uniref:Competence protein ComFB n=1 Tax=Clostridium cavendishii DSM 21758 TaxID=1121302 RepID=A0A1M6HZY3_9CLOT|nr:late competence development ComFB family protein [Clostridium cavendishii]SHJ27747.1 competence protein ComFB [Clostridium cavendishii DSM 21758]